MQTYDLKKSRKLINFELERSRAEDLERFCSITGLTKSKAIRLGLDLLLNATSKPVLHYGEVSKNGNEWRVLDANDKQLATGTILKQFSGAHIRILLQAVGSKNLVPFVCDISRKKGGRFIVLEDETPAMADRPSARGCIEEAMDIKSLLGVNYERKEIS